MPVLDPFTVDAWIVATLLATAGATTTVNGVEVPADVPALVENRIHALRDDFQPVGWPHIIYREASTPSFDNYAQQNVLQDGEFAVYFVMREDLLADVPFVGDLEDYTQKGYIAISEALQGVSQHQAGGLGIVHGCHVLRPWRRFYGEVGQKISEMGVVARIYST